MRRWAPWILLGAGVLAAGLLAGPGGRSGAPGSPFSTQPDGTRAVVEVLRELGATVDITSEPPDASGTAVLVLRDGLDEQRRARLLRWVAGGGTLVVTDVRS